jgi:molecular chaperone IbpA
MRVDRPYLNIASNGEYMMTSIDFTPLYRSTIGFDRLASLIDNAMRSDATPASYPPYNIEALEDDRYAITLAVAGFAESDIDISVEKGVLTVRGKRSESGQRNYLYQGIANRSFERKFNLADYVEVTGAKLENGLLSIALVKEIPEAMKPRKISINSDDGKVIEHQGEKAA